MGKSTTRSVPSLPWDYAQIPTMAPVQVFRHAAVDMVLGGRQWTDEGGASPPRYRRKIGGGWVYISIDHPEVEFGSQVLPALWETARSISWRTLVVAQALLAQWATLTTGVNEAVIISVDRILDYQGLKRIHRKGEPGNWHHGHRTDDRREVAREIRLLERLVFSAHDVDGYPGEGHQGVRKLKFSNTRFIAITDAWGEMRMKEGKANDCSFTHIRYVPGKWAAAYAGAGMHQFGLILNRNLAYDAYRQSWELAMSAYLVLEVFPNNAGRGRPIHRAVETILEAIGQVRDGRRPQRTRRRFEAMMRAMVADGYLTGWAYLDSGTTEAKVSQATWLKSQVDLEPSSQFEECYARRNGAGGRHHATEKR